MFKPIFTLFLLGLSFGSGPCIASCGPVLISYVAAKKNDLLKNIIIYLLFSFARVLVYIVLGLLIFLVGKFTIENVLGNFAKYVFIFGGFFIVILGFFICIGKNIKIKFFQRDKQNIFIIGLIIGLLPCAPLLVMLSYIGLVSKSWPQALLYSTSFGIGTALSPLLLLVIMASFFNRILENLKEVYCRVFNFLCGLVMMLLGIHLIMQAFRGLI
ncbi:MAG: sulfite exporter TauE/SafE family protein [Candidatus Omnitrophota bacterium]